MSNEAKTEESKIPEPVDLLKEVRRKLILQRKTLDKSQTEVATEAKVSSALVHLFEKKNQNISIDNLDRLASAMGMRLIIDVEEIPAPEAETTES